MNGSRVDEEKYQPEFSTTNNSLSVEDREREKIRKNQIYAVKRGLFNNSTFAINEDTYEDNDEKETLIEYMTRTIIENGGKVVPYARHKCHYVV